MLNARRSLQIRRSNRFFKEHLSAGDESIDEKEVSSINAKEVSSCRELGDANEVISNSDEDRTFLCEGLGSLGCKKVSVEQALAHLTSDLPSLRKETKKLSWILAIFLSNFLWDSLEKLSTHDAVPNSRDKDSDEVSVSKVE